MATLDIAADQELPAIRLAWKDGDGDLYDFSTGWTATVKVAANSAPTTTVLTKTAGITLAATSPNYVIEFTAADLATIVAALGTIGPSGELCVLYPYNRRNADSKDLVFRRANPITLRVWAAPT